MAILSYIHAHSSIPATWRILSTCPLEHVQVAILSYIHAHSSIPATWWILSTCPLEHVQVAILSGLTAHMSIPVTCPILSTCPLHHFQVAILTGKTVQQHTQHIKKYARYALGLIGPPFLFITVHLTYISPLYDYLDRNIKK